MEEKLNDNIVIPEDIKKMTREQLEETIKVMEAELKQRDKKVS